MAPRNTRSGKNTDENPTLAEMRRSKIAESSKSKNKVVGEEHFEEPEDIL